MYNIPYIVLENSTLDIWTFVVSALSVFITTILTIYTIRQNTKLKKDGLYPPSVDLSRRRRIK